MEFCRPRLVLCQRMDRGLDFAAPRRRSPRDRQPSRDAALPLGDRCHSLRRRPHRVGARRAPRGARARARPIPGLDRPHRARQQYRDAGQRLLRAAAGHEARRARQARRRQCLPRQGARGGGRRKWSSPARSTIRRSCARCGSHARAYLHGHTVGGTNPSLVEALWAGNAVIAHDNVFNRWTAGAAALFFKDGEACEQAISRLIAGRRACGAARRRRPRARRRRVRLARRAAGLRARMSGARRAARRAAGQRGRARDAAMGLISRRAALAGRGRRARLGDRARRGDARAADVEARRQRVPVVRADARISGAAQGLRLAAVPAERPTPSAARSGAAARDRARFPAHSRRSRPVPRRLPGSAARADRRTDERRRLFV